MFKTLFTALVKSGALTPVVDLVVDRALQTLAPVVGEGLGAINGGIDRYEDWVNSKGYQGVLGRQFVRAVLRDFIQGNPSAQYVLGERTETIDIILDGIEPAEVMAVVQPLVDKVRARAKLVIVS